MAKRSTFAKKTKQNLIKQNKQKCFLFYSSTWYKRYHCFFARLCKSCFWKRRVVFGREEKRRAEPSRAEHKRAQASWVESIYLISNPITKQKDTYLDCRLLSNSRLTYVTVPILYFFPYTANEKEGRIFQKASERTSKEERKQASERASG